MIPYALLRALLFRLDAERAHNLTLACLSRLPPAQTRWMAGIKPAEDTNPVNLLGLHFPNRVGLAAGFDKNGDCIDSLGAMGFGFVEIGTVTPRPQAGNPKPRLFRLPEQRALINRLGFNNAGVDHAVNRLRRRRFNGVVGVNIGKNADTPLSQAADDYRVCLRRVYRYADYVTINVSSPNTRGLRDLQQTRQLNLLLESIVRERDELARRYAARLPLLVKIAPDLSIEQVGALVETLVDFEIDGIIATNTTLARDAVSAHPLAAQTGGLSGEPLRATAHSILRAVNHSSAGRLVVIGVGGIVSACDALAKLDAGADLIQIYTGMVYRGPGIVQACVRAVNR